MLAIQAEGITEITVTAAVAADLANKENYICQQVAGANTVELFTSGIPYVVLISRIQGGSQWRAALIQAGGICPCIAGGAINSPAYVKAKSGGTVEAASSSNLACGTKRYPAAAAASGDVVAVDLGLITMP